MTANRFMVAIAAALLASCGSAEDPATSEKPIVKVNAEALWLDWSGNEAAAQQKYEGKRVAVDGDVLKVEMQGGVPVVTLDTPHVSDTIKAEIVEADKAGAAALQVGTRTSLLCSEVSKSVWVRLDGCRVAKAEVPALPEG